MTQAAATTSSAMPLTPKHRFALAACARWETSSILEWIAYHRAIGFAHIYLYCNDDDPTELYERLLPLLGEESPFITFIHYPFRGFQTQMYKHFLKNFSHDAEWFLFLDIDEFLALKTHDNIPSFMQNYEGICDALYFNWIFFGPNGFARRPEGSVLLQYTRRDQWVNHFTKTLTRRSALAIDEILAKAETGFWHDWGHLGGPELRRINVLGDPIGDYYADFPEKARAYLDTDDRQARIIATAAIHHYAFRAESDIARRLARGTAGDFHGQLAFKRVVDEGYLQNFLNDFNRVEDTYLRDYWRRVLAGGWRASLVPRPPGRNLARGKPATQSSVSQWSHEDTPARDAARLVSGEFSGTYNNHTDFDAQPWWQVDLERRETLREIRIYNRLDSDPGIMARTSALAIAVSDDAQAWRLVYVRRSETPFGGIDGTPLIWTPNLPPAARYVRIIGLRPGYLHFDQVEIY